jgi:hypothetical protein
MDALNDQLREIPPDTPAVLLIPEAGLALVGTYDMGSAADAYGVATSVDVGLLIPNCTCPNPDGDVDVDCSRHYPEAPAALVALIARAVAASRHWSLRAGMGPHIDGTRDEDVNAAEAVAAVLLRPGRHGVFR